MKALNFEKIYTDLIETLENEKVIYTLARRKPNKVISIDYEEGIRVITERSSPKSELVPKWMFETAITHLIEHGSLSNDTLLNEFNVKRSSFVMAALSNLDYIDYITNPLRISLQSYKRGQEYPFNTGKDKLKINNLRKKYKPNIIKCLMIAESPPKSDSDEIRFFYNPELEKYDNLFRSVMTVLYEEFEESYKTGDKSKYLERFRDDGFFLIDAVDFPVNKYDDKKRNQIINSNLKNKLNEIRNLVKKDTPIILIKKNIFEIFYEPLKGLGLNVVNKKFLPFPIPRRGLEWRFKKDLRQYLEDIKT